MPTDLPYQKHELKMLRAALIFVISALLVILVLATDSQTAKASEPIWGSRSQTASLQIDIGSDSMCGRRADGTVKCWGDGVGDSALEMGDNNPSISLPNGSTAKFIASGDEFDCVLHGDGTVRCWGQNSSGQLGQGNTTATTTPEYLPALDLGADKTAIQIAAGTAHACALLSDRTIRCWGDNSSGQLGVGSSEYYIGEETGDMGDNLQTVDLGTNKTAVAVYAEYYQTCAILNDGTVKCWGNNIFGQLGQESGGMGIHVMGIGDEAGEMGDNLSITNLGTNGRAIQLSLGSFHTCALLSTGMVKCWGHNGYSQLGLGDTSTRGDGIGEMGDNLPTVDLGTDKTAIRIATGSLHSCALLNDGTVKCWGWNLQGQLGLGHKNQVGDTLDETGDGLSAVNLGTDMNAIDITAGSGNTCATLSDGLLKCWGVNANGQLGIGNDSTIGDDEGEMGEDLSSTNLGTITNNVVIGLAGGAGHTCALLITGQIKCWGNGHYGVLGAVIGGFVGDEPGEMGENLPTINLGLDRITTQIDASGYHTCALLDGGTVKCWGYNSDGELGQGHTNQIGDQEGEMGDNLQAVDLGTNRTATQIAVAGYSSCALLDDGTMKCWGNNFYGQLGQGNTTKLGDDSNEMGNSLATIDLGTNGIAIQITAGGGQVCALMENGEVKCWGGNNSGELGQGHTDFIGDEAGEMGDNLQAVDLGTNRTAIQIISGDNQVCALLNDGNVKCWGYDSHGNLGQGSVSFALGNEPGEMGDNLPAIDLGTNRTAIQLTSGEHHVCAVLDNGTAKCWGDGGNGKLGQEIASTIGDQPGEMGDNLPAIDLGTNRTAIQISSGRTHSCVLLDNGTAKCWGDNGAGKLGLGHTNHIGLQPGEMGDNLPVIPIISSGPAAPSMPDLPTAQDSGISNSDNITNTLFPTLTGTSEANVVVELYRGETTSLGTTTADASGNWSMIAPSLPDGLFYVSARGRNSNGTSTQSERLTLTLDTEAPSIPSVPDLAASSDSNVSDDDITTDVTPTFSGTSDQNSIVLLYSKCYICTDPYNFATDVVEESTYDVTSWTYYMTGNTSYQIEAVAKDAAGNLSATSTALLIYVENAAPIIGNVTGAEIIEGQTAEISATFTDGSPQNQNRSASVDWGDGTTSVGSLSFSSGSGSVTASHTYVSSETYTVTVTVTDAENMSDSAQTTITVSDAPPQVSLQNSSKTLSLYPGKTVIAGATITDGANETHTAQINWGDGTIESMNVSGKDVSGVSHTYESAGTYTATITVTDSNGVQATDSIVFTATVAGATVAIPSVGTWGLITLATLMLIIMVARAVNRRRTS